ncbi:MAG: alkaline phosphatase family protein [Clostridiales bacterium]|nr:alkaline phosphatase family protein [Clostridiales bacterium]
MDKKVILILVDGMRPDGMMQCGNPYVEELLKKSAYTLKAQTVFPSVTLPCHMSLFHSVDPARHGITTNFFMPQVRPIEGLIERLDILKKHTAFFITWERLRDLCRPCRLTHTYFINENKVANADQKITDVAIRYVNEENPDFIFLYLGDTDETGGHDAGWMSETYLQVVSKAMDCVKRVRDEVPAEYDIILLADHGGHDRSHGTDMPEDMTIPIIGCGPSFTPGELPEGLSIKDIAPTITKLLGAAPADEWEGKPIID